MFFFFQAEDGIRDDLVTGVQTCALPILGRGGTTASQGAALRRATAKGVVVVISTRTGSGAVPGGGRTNSIGAGDLNPQKARVLLCLALTQSSDAPPLRNIFPENPCKPHFPPCAH